MSARKATPKGSVTLVSKEDDGGWKFLHSPSGLADFSLKHALANKKLTLGVGFTDNTVRKIRSLPGVVLSGDFKVNSDVTLSATHNLQNKANKLGVTYNTTVADKKTQVKLNYLTKSRALLGEVASVLAANKKATLNFTEKQLTNVKLALADGPFTYEPSYNLVRKAPSLAVSRPLHGGKYKFGWNLKTDDLTLEYAYKAVKLAAFKRPGNPVPRLAASLEQDLSF